MEKEKIFEAIRFAVEDATLGQLPASGVALHSELQNDLHLDSLDYATLVLNIESDLRIRLDNDKIDWRNVITVEDLVQAIQTHSKPVSE